MSGAPIVFWQLMRTRLAIVLTACHKGISFEVLALQMVSCRAAPVRNLSTARHLATVRKLDHI